MKFHVKDRVAISYDTQIQQGRTIGMAEIQILHVKSEVYYTIKGNIEQR